MTRKLYQPIRKHAKRQLPPFRELYISTNSGEWRENKKHPDGDNIHLWHFNRYPGNKTVLYFHGNSYNISYREYMVKLCEMMKLNLVLVDYRGYGRSDSKPSCQKILKDAKIAARYLMASCDPSQVIVWSESLGGSPGIYVASKYPTLGGLILFSTFASFHGLLEEASGPLRYLMYGVAKAVTQDIHDYTNNLRMIESVKAPVLVLHSRTDTLIPYWHAIALYLAVYHPHKQFITIHGDHDSPEVTLDNIRQIANFIGCDLEEKYHKGVKKIINNLNKEFHTLKKTDRQPDSKSATLHPIPVDRSEKSNLS